MKAVFNGVIGIRKILMCYGGNSLFFQTAQCAFSIEKKAIIMAMKYSDIQLQLRNV
jgi:hypothetical protein